MIRKSIAVLTLFFLLISCNKEIEKPDNLIGEGEMRSIITDIYLYRQTGKNILKKSKPKHEQINLAILQKHGITLEQFKSNYQYYVIKDAAYGDILQEIEDSLSKLVPEEKENKPKINKEKLEAMKVNDLPSKK